MNHEWLRSGDFCSQIREVMNSILPGRTASLISAHSAAPLDDELPIHTITDVPLIRLWIMRQELLAEHRRLKAELEARLTRVPKANEPRVDAMVIRGNARKWRAVNELFWACLLDMLARHDVSGGGEHTWCIRRFNSEQLAVYQCPSRNSHIKDSILEELG